MHTKDLYKNGLNGLNNHDGVVTHTEPDILECEVKQALGSMMINKAIGADGISNEILNPKLKCYIYYVGKRKTQQ